MTNASDPADHLGWESIWNSGNIPARYQTLASPAAHVVAWADTLPHGSFILDLGCGVGRHTVYLGSRDFRMAGLDISSTGIEMTRQACVERQISFEGRVSDISQIPWPDEVFDAVVSTSTIHHHRREREQQAIAEVRRVLKSGGLFLVDFASTESPDYAATRERVTAGEVTEVEPNTFIDEHRLTKDIDGYLPHHFSDEADVRDLLRAFDILDLKASAHSSRPNTERAPVDKWVASARKSISG